MDEFARRPADDRWAYVEEAAARRDLTPIIVEKDFWVCWTLRRLTRCAELAAHVTFKGGTSLSKAYGIIQRFSEDIDLTIARTAPVLCDTASPMATNADGTALTGNERRRRTDALKAAARDYVATVAMPALAREIAAALGSADGWQLMLDPEDADAQTLLFVYPRVSGQAARPGGSDDTGYVRPRVKLEFGARGDPEPSEVRSIIPYLAEDFPDELPDAETEIATLAVARTFWEKATILHALAHNGRLRDGLSRHYYDLVMLDRAGVTRDALEEPDLLARVVRNKSLMFADKAASYETAVLGSLRLTAPGTMRARLEADYHAMAEMFMAPPPSFEELVLGLATLEATINERAG